MKRAPGTGGSSRFTRVGRQVYAAVDGVVVLVGRWGLTGVLPGCLVINVGVVYERNVRCGVLYSKLWVRHEIVDGGSGFGFFQAFVEGATKCVHNTYLREERDRCQRLGKWARKTPPVAQWQQEEGKAVDPPKASLIHLFYRAQFKDCIEKNITQTHGKLKRLERKT